MSDKIIKINFFFCLLISIFILNRTAFVQDIIDYKKIEEAQRTVRSTSDELHDSAEKLFLQSSANLEAGRFWECARDLVILIDFYPAYSRMDSAVFMLGDCLYEMGLLEGAAKIYTFLVKKYVLSPILGNALLGLLRIEYSRGDYTRCLEYYQAIRRANPSTEVMNCARYFAGLCYYKLKDYPNALETLSRVNDKSIYYDYSLYNMALSLLKMKKVKRGIQVFQELSALPVSSSDRRTLINETHLSLGYTYYELGQFQDALTQFRMISPDYKGYANALLAAGWSAVKMKDFRTAIGPLTDLVSRYPKGSQTEEAFFLLGDSYLKLDLYDDALKIYDSLLTLFPKREFDKSYHAEVLARLAQEKEKLEDIKMELFLLESRLMEVIPLGMGSVPGSLKQEKNDILIVREGLLKQIFDERELFNDLALQMDELTAISQVQENKRDWRAFAEYGRSRVLFLQSMNSVVQQ